MAFSAYPESSPGATYRARCCGALLQSMHRYHIVRCDCGRCAVDGGNTAPRLVCHDGSAAEWLERMNPVTSGPA
jgi:hypothetical protein